VRAVADWLDEYGTSHRNAVNKRLHFVCVPAIVLSILGLLWSLPVPNSFGLGPWLNWGTLAVALTLVYYLSLSPGLAFGTLVAFALLFLILRALLTLPWPLWASCLAIFVLAWVGQFIGHAVEGKRPSFFKDVQFLLIGPLWLIAALYQRLGVRY
jgi:uncharacterized membrane protein YGL010W